MTEDVNIHICLVDILYKVTVLYNNICVKITGSMAELEHSRRMLSHARRAYIGEVYICARTKIYSGDIDKHEVVKCVFGAYMGALR